MMPLNHISRWSTLIIAVIATFSVLPALFDKVWTPRHEEPLVFFSPVQKNFVYQKSLGSHQFLYADESGREFSRQEWEDLLPFVYFRNYELRNEEPLKLAGTVFDSEAVRTHRQSFEIKARDIRGRYPQIPIYPLFNNNPAVTMLPFPEDVFRFTKNGMEFIHADTNRKDETLSHRFTENLKAEGFVFPATLISGNPTNLKPFDEGYFVQDSKEQVFHIRRVLDQPHIRKTAIPPDMDILDIIISENQRREFYGLLITKEGGIFLITWHNYELIPLPSAGYDPDRMNIKLLVNPLYRTLILTEGKKVHATAMDRAYQPIHSFTLPFSHENNSVRHIKDFLFPLVLSLESPWQNQATLQLHTGGVGSLAGIVLAMLLYLVLNRNRPSSSRVRSLVFLAVTGLPGICILLCLHEDSFFT
ncbi:DUF4857 domain-containing protein [Desulfobotulus sp. H1]|uniref:DUF4857 domain-containing protein n=1 Tax=Desulfobotulus pelophilus TaxID=2823377 RepID=A0ABT3N7W1_9BACT|nr:DUF4857 domain-containing protein [Desulfobotulus pelophilus]MCW7753551.1 DUF4857 domain-containing protein [Desulfobotulus pelophilus]